MRVCVVGCGRQGLVMAAFFAEIGHRVRCIADDPERRSRLERGELSVREPGLGRLLAFHHMAGNLSFSTALAPSVAEADVVLMAIETPPSSSGEPDLTALRRAAQQVGAALEGETLIALKGMIPIGCAAWVGMWLAEAAGVSVRAGAPARAPAFEVVTLPGPLRAGSALRDAFEPPCLLVGATAPRALEAVRALYAPWRGSERIPLVATDPATAELVPFAASAFLATRAAFSDELTQLCERFGASQADLALGLGLDPRLAGAGGWAWGERAATGELAALNRLAEEYGETPGVLRAAQATLSKRRAFTVTKLQRHLKVLKGRTVVLMGLDAAPDDGNASLPLDLAEHLLSIGVKVRAYDPEGGRDAAARCPALVVAACPYEAARGADALIFDARAAWTELDLSRLRRQVRTPFLLDARNALSPGEVRAAGFAYAGIGRST
ncbi:UDP-glucose/GDP-mannose dehydrogenase family protein [bacterium]|nr:UDP-glucose/GDP-mannose dehydrogenase family protein [bacterium]